MANWIPRGTFGIQQAIAAKANAIVLVVVDCAVVEVALQHARAAKIAVFGISSFDCSQTTSGAPSLIDGGVNYGPFRTFTDWSKAYAATFADYQIAQTQGHVKAIVFDEADLNTTKIIADGYLTEMARCKTCEVLVHQKISLSDLNTTLQQTTATLINRYPQANAIFGVSDSQIQSGIGAAVRQSGRAKSLIVTGGECFAANVALIRGGQGQTMCGGYASVWAGWGAMDALNRYLQHQPIADSGIGWRSTDATHNLPATDTNYNGTKDYKTAYTKIWGVG